MKRLTIGFLPVEFELVKQALYVDPYDQSAWIYHRWLVGGGGPYFILRPVSTS